jgi:hypothetical protein
MAQAALADPLRPASTQDVRPPDFTYNLKILMGWFQITTSLLSVMAVSWPVAYATFMSNFNVVNFSFIPVWFSFNVFLLAHHSFDLGVPVPPF